MLISNETATEEHKSQQKLICRHFTSLLLTTVCKVFVVHQPAHIISITKGSHTAAHWKRPWGWPRKTWLQVIDAIKTMTWSGRKPIIVLRGDRYDPRCWGTTVLTVEQSMLQKTLDCFQWFDTVGWAAGMASSLSKMGEGMVEVGSA